MIYRESPRYPLRERQGIVRIPRLLHSPLPNSCSIFISHSLLPRFLPLHLRRTLDLRTGPSFTLPELTIHLSSPLTEVSSKFPSPTNPQSIWLRSKPPHLTASRFATMPFLIFTSSFPGPPTVSNDGCYLLACVWCCYCGRLEVGDDPGEYNGIVGECEGGT
jgi:hypothetical protein